MLYCLFIELLDEYIFMMNFLPVSVIMPTYNTKLEMLKESVESILNQTFRDFEFIIIDDGSTNGTDEYLNGIQDNRVRIIKNLHNIGITKSLNIGLREAGGKYIARMDADDISLPKRLEKQFIYMEAHPDVVMCGCWFQYFGQKVYLQRSYILDIDHYRIKTLFGYPDPAHSTMFIRHEMLTGHNITYNEELPYAQDYALCAELGNLGEVQILPEVLLRRRIHPKRVSDEHYKEQKQCHMVTQKKLLIKLLGDVTDAEVALHYRYSYEKKLLGVSDAIRCFRWYLKLICTNNRVRKYPKRKFIIYVCKMFMLVTVQSFMPKVASVIISIRDRIVLK